MIAKDGGRTARAWVVGLTILGGASTAYAQQAPRAGKTAAPVGKATTADPKPDVIANARVSETKVPVNPTDAIAIVNDQIISRQQLADECVARKGKEILETLINRALIDQALKAQKKEVTAPEIDEEINSVAARFGIGREAWLRTLDKERGISPYQYARDIIYPSVAMRKLCEGRVQVTEDDLKEAFEAQYGDKIRCRLIMVDKLSKAQDIWENLRKNPAGFEKIAQDQSMDLATRSLGGLVAEALSRHSQPKNLAESAFSQLVDGDPNDKDPSHKPKDGDFTGPIQAGENVWVILRRESLEPARANVSLKDEAVRQSLHAVVYDVKLKEAMGEVFEDLVKKSAIENKLTSTVKLANEEQDPDYRVDGEVKLMSGEGQASSTARPTPVQTDGPRPKLPTPAAMSSDAAAEFEKLNETKSPQNPSAVTPTPGSPN